MELAVVGRSHAQPSAGIAYVGLGTPSALCSSKMKRSRASASRSYIVTLAASYA